MSLITSIPVVIFMVVSVVLDILTGNTSSTGGPLVGKVTTNIPPKVIVGPINIHRPLGKDIITEGTAVLGFFMERT